NCCGCAWPPPVARRRWRSATSLRGCRACCWWNAPPGSDQRPAPLPPARAWPRRDNRLKCASFAWCLGTVTHPQGPHPVIEFQQVLKNYRVAGRDVPALQPTDLRVETGEVFGLIGHSGAGKSTLLRLINRLENPSGGRIIVDDEEVTALDADGLRRFRRQVGMIFQHFNLLSSKTVADNVALPLRLAGELPAADIDRRVAELLRRVGLEDHARKYPAQLSGGQRHRVGIARALATDPKILLCDEATSALDPQTTAQVLQLLAEINRELGLTIVLITHEMDVIRRVCDRVAVMDAGRIVEQGAVADVFLHPHHPTTRRFVLEDESVDEHE